MRDPVLRSFSSLPSSSESWYQRVRENFSQLMTADGFLPTAANGAPIHIAHVGKSGRSRRAAWASVLTHAAIVGLLLSIVAGPPRDGGRQKPSETGVRPLTIPSRVLSLLRGVNPSDGMGSGGDRNPKPPTSGNLPPRSSEQFFKPSVPKTHSILATPETIFDPNAAPILIQTSNIGLPWMKEATDSGGPGNNHTIGSSKGDTVGDSSKDGPGGRGERLNTYRAGLSEPRCAYCPDPQYTDEAREAKLQGAVMLQVLVGADGRASQIRVTKGLGLGLEERSVQAIRGWRFVPARDAAHRAVPAWITIEAVFRLF
jgi:periplasmic protein TonB